MQRPIDRKAWCPYAFIGLTDAVYRSMTPTMMTSVVLPARAAIMHAMRR